LFAGPVLIAGCNSNSGGQSGSSTGSKKTATNGGDAGTESAAQADKGEWENFPDVPYVPIMQEVDGTPIPRQKVASMTHEIGGEIPADVANEYARTHPGAPATGDQLAIRFPAEPESLNPITESSAVQTYIFQNVHDTLAWENLETLVREPDIAERWVIEDSVKLSADYAGLERRIAVGDGEPSSGQEVNYEAAASEGAEPPVLKFTTSGKDGQPLGGVWVGLFPKGRISGAPTVGYHYWSGDDGTLEVSSIVPGTYMLRVGAELFGKTTENEDGSLSVTSESPENPLTEMLGSEGETSLTLSKDQWVDVQAETIFTYFLRPDVTWSDGAPFTTKDLEFALAVLNNPYVDGEDIRVYYQDLISCVGLDEKTVRMKYRQQYFNAFAFTADLAFVTPPWHLFESFFKEDGKTLTMERLTPAEETAQNKVSAHGQVFGKFFNTDDRYNLAPMGTGPYVVESWDRAERVVLKRRNDYWNPERAGYLDRIIIKFIIDDLTSMQALKGGEIDFFYRMNSEQYFEDLAGPPDWFKERYVKAEWFSPQFGYVGWNMLKPLFQDRRVRIALAMLFDVQEFIDKKLQNSAVRVVGSQYYFGPGYDHTVQPLAYDPETARDLLSDAGWADTDNDGVLDKDGQKFEFTFLLPPGNPMAAERAALMQRAYKEAGIQMEIRQQEWASFLEKIKSKDYDVCSLAWASPLESDPFQIWHGSQAGADKRGSNHVSFSDPEADELIELIRVTLDKEERKRVHWSLQRILDREQPYLFLYTPKEFGAYHHRFQGVKWFPLRPGFDLRQWYVPKDQQQN
jgi:peptide/nickel transport system substrate-binding protein